MKNLFLIIFVLTVLPGCGLLSADKSTVTETISTDGTKVTTTTNVANNDTASHYNTYEAHVTSDDKKIISMVEDVTALEASDDCIGECLGYFNGMKLMTIGWGVNFRATPFNQVRPTSGMDVLKDAVVGAKDVLRTGSIVYGSVELGKSLLDSVGNDIRFGKNGTMADSFNEEKPEIHSTSIGDETTLDSSLVNPPAEQESVDELLEEMPGELAR